MVLQCMTHYVLHSVLYTLWYCVCFLFNRQILFKICTDHPYHSLYVILALSNASLDNEFPQNGYVTGTRGQPPAGKKMRRSSVTPTSGNVRSVDEVL